MLVRLRVIVVVVMIFGVVVVMIFGVVVLPRNDDDEILRRNILVLSCPSDLLLRVLGILIMFIFGRIVLGVVRGVLEVRLHTPSVIEVGLVIEDVGI